MIATLIDNTLGNILSLLVILQFDKSIPVILLTFLPLVSQEMNPEEQLEWLMEQLLLALLDGTKFTWHDLLLCGIELLLLFRLGEWLDVWSEETDGLRGVAKGRMAGGWWDPASRHPSGIHMHDAFNGHAFVKDKRVVLIGYLLGWYFTVRNWDGLQRAEVFR